METVKIVQIIIGPDNSAYQSALLGLGSDGIIYHADNDNKWHEYFPNRFAEAGLPNGEAAHSDG